MYRKAILSVLLVAAGAAVVVAKRSVNQKPEASEQIIRLDSGENPTVAPNAATVKGESVSQARLPAPSAPTIDQEIEGLDRQIRERQDVIERQDVVARLNEGRVNPAERQVFYQLLNAQAQDRSRHVELRLQRLRAKMNLGG